MTAKSKQKGNSFERSIVKDFIKAGWQAKRAYGSNGNALGQHEEVDVLAYQDYENLLDGTTFTDKLLIQCKKRKKIPAFLSLTENVDCVVFQEDRGDKYIMLRLDDFIERFL